MLIIETSVFTKQVTRLLTDEDYRQLQLTLAQRPTAGALIKNGGGLRKIRWTLTGRGKRGGARVIYYWAVQPEHLLMLFVYPKNEQDDLTDEQVQILRKIIESEYP